MRKIQNKKYNTVFHLSLKNWEISCVGKDVEKQVHSYITGQNINEEGNLTVILKKDIPYDPETPLLGIHKEHLHMYTRGHVPEHLFHFCL